MKYMLMICRDEGVALTPQEGAEIGRATDAWIAETDGRGVRLLGNRLRPVADATTVRVRGGQTLVADGPFAETKEQIAGFDVIECADLDEAHRGGGPAPGGRHRDDRGEAVLGGLTADAGDAVAEAFREEWGRVVAALIGMTGNWDLAEECAQDAFAQALKTWPRDGVPRRPGAWLTTVARNRATRPAAPQRDRGRQAEGGSHAGADRRSRPTTAMRAASATTGCG